MNNKTERPRPSAPPSCPICGCTRKCYGKYCKTKKIHYLGKEELEILSDFKDHVIDYVDTCDKLGVILGRNFFIKVIDRWNAR